MRGGCESFTSIIINLRKLRNFQHYLVTITFCIEMGQRITSACNLEVSHAAVHCKFVHAVLEGLHETHWFA